ncbi:MAG TPA: virulence factor SrfC family protein [Burkholderiaceae bacterium]|nr:virulence factor SrfC family protein [Burkholderiaceae bacterium]
MTDPGQQRLRDCASGLAAGSAGARGWIAEVAQNAKTIAAEEQSLIESTRRAENLSRKLAASASRRNCVGVFGPSQAGKSYLVSVLARTPGKTLMADFAGDLKNFISEINPAGDRESTGLVTRFTVEPGTRDTAHPVELRLLGETDLVKILGNSFYSDFDPNLRRVMPPEEDVIRAAIAALEPQALPASAPHLDEIVMFDIGEYFRAYFPTGVERFHRAGYWEALARFGHRLPLAARAKLYGLLWGDLEDFTRMFLLLAGAAESLGFAPEARAAIAALVPREASIIDVETLSRLGKPEDAADRIAVVPVFGGPTAGAAGTAAARPAAASTPAAAPREVQVPRAVLTALIAEVKVVMTDRPWRFFEHTDLLDFPGARSREKQVDLPAEKDEREDRVRTMLLRGKIAYLFQRYTEERELTSMLLCMPPSNQEVKDLAAMVRGWVDQTHGATPEQRARIQCALFLVLTKFDMDFIEKEGDTSESRKTKFDRRLDASFLKLYGRDEWTQNWDGKPFRNTVFLRNPGMKQTHIMKYAEIRTMPDGSEQRIEEGPDPSVADKLTQYRQAFEQSDICRKHFDDPPGVWQAAFMPNDGGVSFLVARLESVLAPELKARQIEGRLTDQARALGDRLRRFYRADDDQSRKEKEDALLGIRRRLFNAARPRGFVNFVQLVSLLTIPEIDVREAFLNVAALKLEPLPAPATADEGGTDGEDPWDDPWADAGDAPEAAGAGGTGGVGGTASVVGTAGAHGAGGAASTGGAARWSTHVQRDRSDLFATQVTNLWTERVRGLAFDHETLAVLGLDARLVGDMVDELVVGAHREQLTDRVAAATRRQVQAANVRWDEVADRAATIAANLINDYVAFLGFADQPPDQRPGFPEPPKARQRAVFQWPEPVEGVQGAGVGPAGLGERRRPMENDYFIDWGVALRQAGVDNASFSGGREITDDQNRRLGRLLTDIDAAAAFKV